MAGVAGELEGEFEDVVADASAGGPAGELVGEVGDAEGWVRSSYYHSAGQVGEAGLVEQAATG